MQCRPVRIDGIAGFCSPPNQGGGEFLIVYQDNLLASNLFRRPKKKWSQTQNWPQHTEPDLAVGRDEFADLLICSPAFLPASNRGHVGPPLFSLDQGRGQFVGLFSEARKYLF